MKIKIIDLLNKIANIEEVPKKIRIKFKGFSGYDYYKYDEMLNWYVTFDESTIMQIGEITDLNSEVEIIEEKKKIELPEKLETGISYQDVKRDIVKFVKENRFALNEIIDYLKAKEDK